MNIILLEGLVLINCKEKFLYKSVKNGNKEAARELLKIFGSSEEKFHDAVYLHQQVITKYNPIDAVRIVYSYGDFSRLSKTEIEKEFLYYYALIAKYMYDNKFYRSGVRWAKKGMNLFELFHSSYPESMKISLRENSQEYQLLKKRYEEHEQYFDEDLYYGGNGYTGLKWDWEDSYSPSIYHNNDNTNQLSFQSPEFHE